MTRWRLQGSDLLVGDRIEFTQKFRLKEKGYTGILQFPAGNRGTIVSLGSRQVGVQLDNHHKVLYFRNFSAIRI